MTTAIQLAGAFFGSMGFALLFGLPRRYLFAASLGGLLAWAIISILLCLFPGIVALLNVLRVNKCATVEEQQRALSQARTWCIVATVLGVLYLIYTIVTGGGAAARLLG